MDENSVQTGKRDGREVSIFTYRYINIYSIRREAGTVEKAVWSERRYGRESDMIGKAVWSGIQKAGHSLISTLHVPAK